MVFRKKLSCLWTLSLCLVASKSSPKTPTITDQSFIDQCVSAHNELRGEVTPTAADMKHMVRKNLAGILFLGLILRYLSDRFHERICMSLVGTFSMQLEITPWLAVSPRVVLKWMKKGKLEAVPCLVLYTFYINTYICYIFQRKQ